ncbi:hypothetical protein GCM10025778_30800 [Paeniglutamicibacter antarcticus]|uniref:Transposase n=1 Tax=Paeniglutamicibacter antarcticus TaxID=494023 RepID=A0ABP9TPL0_9MICC
MDRKKSAESSRRTKDLEKENARLKKLLADQMLANDILSEVAKGKFWAVVAIANSQRTR